LLDESFSSFLLNDYENFEDVLIDCGSVDGTIEYDYDNWPVVLVLRTEKTSVIAVGLFWLRLCL